MLFFEDFVIFISDCFDLFQCGYHWWGETSSTDMWSLSSGRVCQRFQTRYAHNTHTPMYWIILSVAWCTEVFLTSVSSSLVACPVFQRLTVTTWFSRFFGHAASWWDDNTNTRLSPDGNSQWSYMLVVDFCCYVDIFMTAKHVLASLPAGRSYQSHVIV